VTPETSEERCLMAGATAYFQKPADNDELLQVISGEFAAHGGDGFGVRGFWTGRSFARWTGRGRPSPR